SLLILSPLPPSLLHPTHPLQPPSFNLPTYLLSLLTPTTSLLILYHTDIPPPPPSRNPYAPAALTLLSYLATTLLTTHSLPHHLAHKRAADLSRPPPRFGLAEETTGILCGLGANAFATGDGMVLEMRHRRRSGREVDEMFFLPSPSPSPSTSTPSSSATATAASSSSTGNVILLDDHPLFAATVLGDGDGVGEGEADGEELGQTFSLGLTERQRRAREGVVLPYFDAQRSGEGAGRGDGGRILYEMGREDDFDEEEDEV
ncbi:MAG: hypothetical protein Q9202_006546, partial [Teloschistes flavicans]